MIQFQRHILSNGLKVLVHEDHSTPLATFNILYQVGARDETPDKTGMAHLFEHFMFEGSAHIPEYDTPLQKAGGENNAFTSSDITNYYDIVPSNNLETAFWLESDRMLELDFNNESLETQKKVVIEEFKENYINQPYGDVWHLISDLAYKTHPYRYPVIGKEISHIEKVSMEDARSFFYKYYRPNNAILCVAGGVKTDEVFRLAEKWFGSIPPSSPWKRTMPAEPPQTESRSKEVYADVPVTGLYLAYPMAGRIHETYYATDLLRDVLSTGESSRLYQKLVKEKKLFSSLSAYCSETIDPGILFFDGKLAEGVDPQAAESELDRELTSLAETAVSEDELNKVKNKMEAYLLFGETNVMNRAMNLAYFEMLGDAALINSETERYRAVTSDQLRKTAAEVFLPSRKNILRYYSKS